MRVVLCPVLFGVLGVLFFERLRANNMQIEAVFRDATVVASLSIYICAKLI
jgi:hypothetical protein